MAARKSTRTRTVARVTVYTRVSESRTDGERGGRGEDSVERQLERCEAYAEAQGWTIVARHRDVGISAYSGAARPGWARVMADVVAEQTDAVLVFALDRAGRNTAALLKDVEIMTEHGVGFVSVTQPIDTSSSYGAIILAVLAAVAQTESAMKRERATSKYADEVANGEWYRGDPGFGYRVEGGRLVVVEDEADAIRAGAATLLNGGSLRTVVRDWQAAGFVTTATSVRKRFESPTIAGLRLVDGDEVVGGWEPILTRTDWTDVNAIFDSRRIGHMQGTRHLLTGLAVCAVDGAKLVGRPAKGHLQYLCLNGPEGKRAHMGIDGRQLEAWVDARASQMYLADAKRITDPSQAAPAERARLAEVEALLAAQADQLAAGVPASVVAQAARKLEAERVELLAAIEQAATTWTRMFDEVNREPREGEQRAALEEVIERIVVSPTPNRGRYPIEKRTEIVWRDGVEQAEAGSTR